MKYIIITNLIMLKIQILQIIHKYIYELTSASRNAISSSFFLHISARLLSNTIKLLHKLF